MGIPFGGFCARLPSCLQVADADTSAEWRHQRLSTLEFIHRQKELGKKISPIFSVYGVSNRIFRFDRLHAVDQGVAADFFGNIMETLLPKMQGDSKAAQCETLNRKLQAFYQRHKVPDKVKCLKLKHFKRPSPTQPAKLKMASAAEVRCMAPFISQLTQEFCSEDCPQEVTMRLAAQKLEFCYIALAKNSLPAREELLQTCSREFAQLYKALHQKSTDGIAWRPKPKMHQLLELCSEPGCDPTTSWCYRDEDAGGPISKVCRMRGRWNNLTYWSEHAFQMFYMKYPLPKIQKHTPR